MYRVDVITLKSLDNILVEPWSDTITVRRCTTARFWLWIATEAAQLLPCKQRATDGTLSH